MDDDEENMYNKDPAITQYQAEFMQKCENCGYKDLLSFEVSGRFAGKNVCKRCARVGKW